MSTDPVSILSTSDAWSWAVPDSQAHDDDDAMAHQAAAALADARIVYVGESHDAAAHHLAQAALIEAARAQGRPVVIAAEMFPWASASTTAAYSDAQLTTAAFVESIAWDEVWGFDWRLYAPVFELALERDVRLVGINAPEGASRAVFERGRAEVGDLFDASLPVGDDVVDPAYRAFLAESLTAHGMPADSPDFDDTLDRFVAAQRVWDRSMGGSIAALDAALPPATVIVVIVGAGHVAGPGRIPDFVRTMRPGVEDVVVSCIRHGEPMPSPDDVDLVCVSTATTSD
jgi:uncharacterized iron-regulated protein